MTKWQIEWKSAGLIYYGLLVLCLTQDGISAASLNHQHGTNKNIHLDKISPASNLYENQQQTNLKENLQKVLDRPEKLPENAKLLKKTNKQPILHSEEDLYKIFHEKDPRQQNSPTLYMVSQKMNSPVKKSTNVEQEQERRNDRTLYTLLLLPWLMYPVSKASYFTILELFNAYGDKKGVSDELAFLLQIFLQCVDFVALTRGRFKFIDGGNNNMQQEMLDYFLTKMGALNYEKLAVQILLPANDWPEYEEKRK